MAMNDHRSIVGGTDSNSGGASLSSASARQRVFDPLRCCSAGALSQYSCNSKGSAPRGAAVSAWSRSAGLRATKSAHEWRKHLIGLAARLSLCQNVGTGRHNLRDRVDTRAARLRRFEAFLEIVRPSFESSDHPAAFHASSGITFASTSDGTRGPQSVAACCSLRREG